jgi:hypothetical protein
MQWNSFASSASFAGSYTLGDRRGPVGCGRQLADAAEGIRELGKLARRLQDVKADAAGRLFR